MATADPNNNPYLESTAPTQVGAQIGAPQSNILVDLLRALGSLKLTVGLFAVSLIIVLVGTLAQDEMNMFDVKQRYFTCWLAWLHFDDFFPQAFFPHEKAIRGVIPFPGGATVGVLLMLNLVAAKATRFRIDASGGKLVAGIATMLVGLLVMSFIIFSGNSTEGLQGEPPAWLGYSALWRSTQVGLLAGFALSLFGFLKSANRVIGIVCMIFAAAFGGYLLYTLFYDARISDPGLRIVWQLTKGLGAGVILMVACLTLFGKQGGNVLLHLGVALLMFGQFIFGDRQLEQRLSLVEGESTNSLVNLDAVELTFIKDEDDKEIVTAIPGSRLLVAAQDNSVISDQRLPVDVKIVEFYPNSNLTDVGDDNPATKGTGLEVQAVQKRKSGGTSSEVNMAAAYIQLLDKDSGDALGTHLVSQVLSDREILMPGQKTKNVYDEVSLAEQDYRVGLRYHREVKPYWVQLEDVRRTNYSGTETPRDYSSFIRIIDPATGEDLRERVWMNNPLRFRGETFFQSSYIPLPNGKEATGLQVVQNSGWLIPYVACSITALGMLLHFLGTLQRFINRREREVAKEFAANPIQPKSQTPVVIATAIFALLTIGSLAPWKFFGKSIPADSAAAIALAAEDGDDTKLDLWALGQIPVKFGGRVMPLDAYARQTLKAMSNKESLPLDTLPTGIKKRAQGKSLSALEWLMEVAVDEPKIRFVPMFRIDSDEIRSELELERRKTKLYSLEEIGPNYDRIETIVKAARNKEAADQTFKEKKATELDMRTRNYTLAAACFQLPTPPNIPADLFPEGTSVETQQMFAIQQLERKLGALVDMRSPNIIPPTPEVAADAVDDPDWAAFAPAFFQQAKSNITSDEETDRAGVVTFGEILKAYAQTDQDDAGENEESGTDEAATTARAEAFNLAVTQHLISVQSYDVPGYSTARVAVERWMQSKWPTGVAMIWYIGLLVLCLIHLMANSPRLNNAIWCMLIVTFLVHTFALVCRIWITNRAPVINIYSSAVFIGWGAVAFGLTVEALYRRGMGNMLAATAGMLTLLVAYGLNTGDTMPVLQAVLDTQFWLSTHVISVSLGYVATLVAGFFGIGYLLANWFGSESKTQRELYRCCYGTACFGILFSFVGTVLGGLWADDSWGRFWGWDPKENGALLIVIWNAMMLHARWDGMVKARGFSVLAIGGNIVTAWSWFGTNELGIGLHSYGFTSGVLMWLTIFIFSQLAFIAAGIAFVRPTQD